MKTKMVSVTTDALPSSTNAQRARLKKLGTRPHTWRYVAGIVVVLVLAFVVARQDQHAADLAAQKAAESHKTAIFAETDKHDTRENIPTPNVNSPSSDPYYKLALGLFRWPIGTGTWALLLTLLAIAEQTHQTRRAADTAADSARIAQAVLIATQRPRFVVKRISLIPGKLVDENGTPTLKEDLQWRIACVVANRGGSKAEIIDSNLTIQALGIGTLEGLLPSLPCYGKEYSFQRFSIEPGERLEKIVVLSQQPDTAKFRVLDERFKLNKVTSTSPLICFGFFHYRDESGVGRLTGFGAQWNPKDMSFARLKSTEYEYRD